MEYKKFHEISLSRLGMGNMRLPVQGDVDGAPIDRERAQQIIDFAMENGINYYDTAYVYHSGESESFLGEALKKYDRSSYYVATKFLMQAERDFKKVFETQLERLQTDYIDFYLIHAISDQTWEEYVSCGCIEYFLEQKKAGKIKYLGFSAHAKPENLEKFAAHHDWDFAQIQLNYFDWNYGTAKKEYEILEKKNIPVMVMEPVRGGRLAVLSSDAEEILKTAHPEWSIASWALRWVKSLPQVQLVLSGMSNLEQIKDNVRTFGSEGGFTKEDEEVLFKACDAFKNQVQVPCTACRYCCDGCPVKINIPAVLQKYNKYKTDGPWVLKGYKTPETEGNPQDCVKCGACTAHCPQKIDIPVIMSEVSDILRRG